MITTLTADVLVAGTAGGVGTTTVTALLFDAFRRDSAGAARLFDHSAGELGLRLPEGDDVPVLNSGLALHDLGAHAGPAVSRLDVPRALLILVAPATPLGCVAADQVLEQVVERHGGSQLRRVLVAAVGVFGRHRIAPSLDALRSRVGARSVVLLPQDRSLAAGGRIPTIRLTTHTEQAQRQLTAILRERLCSL